ncbi:beta-xylanase [Portibacter lacus]|uniref:Beta-xylanase n=2 Tax=Portibacter lacus TaxID=1099794 RepID=A0AA37WG58_9BACT|nr:endo-1,4-beta-xylanase [Portibacter lacus]GLR19528.1 beta-xylanase [Portibacter lacus]
MKKLAILLFLFSLQACGPKKSNSEENHNSELTLKKAFKDDFTIGTAMNVHQIYKRDASTDSVIQKHFNSIVAENCMKSMNIHPEIDRFFWDDSDAFVQYGIDHHMEIIGHNLAWHSQTPSWLFIDENGNDVDREEMLKRLHDHIVSIMTRYKGKIKGYDVVNEAINDDGSMRESKFYQIIGPDWVEQAFKFAAEADPSAELYYNDYNMSNQIKSKAVYKMVQQMQEKGIKVDGIGMQGHLNVGSPSLKDFEKSIIMFSELGKVMVTELDVTVLPWPDQNASAEVSLRAEYQEEMNPYPSGMSDSMSQALNNRYIDIFDLLLKHKAKVSRVTLWGVNDNQTWRNNWPIEGRRDYPLLFNRDNTPKPAVDSIMINAVKI